MSKRKSRLADALLEKTALGEGGNEPAEIPITPDSQPPGSEADDESDQLRFSLQFYRISERLAVINEVPYLGNERNGKQVGKLLQAILRALGQELPELPAAVRFNWPLSADDDASQSRAPEAYQALQGFLGKQLGSKGDDVVLVFGSQCEELFARSGLDQLFVGSSRRVVHTHSLDAMLQVPALKRSVWDSIRVLPEQLG